MPKIDRDSNVMKVLVILGIIILPLVYSLFYLKGFWDPYNSLDKVPVALVNLDECTENCKSDELVKNLKDKDVLGLKVVDEKTADKGLIDKDYYAVIKIPKDFTESLNNASNEDRKPVDITYASNTKTSYLASQIIGSAVKEIKAELQSNINKEITSTLTTNLKSVPEQTKQISNAFGTIASGTKTLNNGAFELKNGLNTLNTNYKDFNNGVEKIAQGTNDLYNQYGEFDKGIKKAYNGAEELKEGTKDMPALVEGLSSLNQGSETFSKGLDEYEININNLIKTSEEAYKVVSKYCTDNMIMETDSQDTNKLKPLCIAVNDYLAEDSTLKVNGLAKLKAAYGNIKTGYQSIDGGINNLYSQTENFKKLYTGISDLDNGLSELQQGSSKVYNGIKNLNAGANTLNSSSKQVSEGINKLNSGSSTLASGTTTLNNGVNEAKKEVDKKIDDTKKETDKLTGLDSYSKTPVKIKEEAYGDVKVYGTFFSPYFMSLSLWVGGILILMGLYYDPDNRFKVLGRDSESRGKRLIFYNVIGIVQAIILAFILQSTLGFKVTNIFLFYGSCILISEAFLSIIMFLFFNFKDIGKFLALIFLVMQLASCGGTFPIETEPAIYQAIYPFMPMTYSVDLLRESFVNINSSFLVKDVTVLLIILVVFNGLTFITGTLKNKKATTKKKAKK